MYKSHDEQLMFGVSKKQFAVYCLQVIGIFAATFFVLYVFGLTPKSLRQAADVQNVVIPVKPVAPQNQSHSVQTAQSSSTRPSRVVIPSIGVDSTILHPQSPNVEVLDAALTKGAVYYPGSGTIEEGNVFLFGHSTNWQIVRNEAYKTFNGLEKLKSGDVITIWGEDGEVYTYTVETVSLADENSAMVNFDTNGRRLLTISTCNTFGAKQERWVVQAVFNGRS